MKNQPINYREIKRKSRFIASGCGGVGGVGKTTIAVAIADYLRQRRIPVRLFDAENEPKPHGRLKNYFPEAQVIDIHSKSSLDEVARSAVHDKVLTLVDLPAGAGPELLEWIKGPIRAFQRQNVPMTLVSLLSSAPQTLTCVLRWVLALDEFTAGGAKIDHLLTLNHRDPGLFSHLESEAGKAFLETYKPGIIHLAGRDPNIYAMLEGKDLSPVTALELFRAADTDQSARDRLGKLDDPVTMSHIEEDVDQISQEFDKEIHRLLPEADDSTQV